MDTNPMYLPPMPMFKLNFVIPLTAKSITHCKSWLYLEILIFFLVWRWWSRHSVFTLTLLFIHSWSPGVCLYAFLLLCDVLDHKIRYNKYYCSPPPWVLIVVSTLGDVDTLWLRLASLASPSFWPFAHCCACRL